VFVICEGATERWHSSPIQRVWKRTKKSL